MAEKLYSYADKQVMEEVGSGGGGSGGGGSGGGSTMIIHVDENGILDKTWNQIHDYMSSGGMAIIIGEGLSKDDIEVVCYAQTYELEGTIFYSVGCVSHEYLTRSKNEYPGS